MSESTSPAAAPLPPAVPIPAATPGGEPAWAKPAVSILALVIFVGGFVVAYLSKNENALTLMEGAAITMAGTVVNYYLGSSSGSAKKTEIASSVTAPAP